MSDSPLGRGRGRQAFGVGHSWRATKPTPALSDRVKSYQDFTSAPPLSRGFQRIQTMEEAIN